MEVQLRTLRMVRAALLVAAVIYALLAERLAKPQTPVANSFYFAMMMVAFVTAVVAVFLRNKVTPMPAAGTPLDRTDRATMQRWMASYIVPYALAESIVLEGFVLRFVGASLAQAIPFYAVGIALLLVFTPQLP